MAAGGGRILRLGGPLLVRRHLDNQNFAAYKIQGWYRQYRHDRFEKIMYRTKQVAKKVMAATLPKAKSAFQKAGAFFKKVFRRQKDKIAGKVSPTF